MSERLRDYGLASSYGFAVGATVLGLTGSGIDAYRGSDKDDIVSLAETSLDEARSNISRFETNQTDLLEKYGTVCVTAVMPYTATGPLAETGEDSVVDDLLTSSDLPCSDDPTEVRTAVRQVVANEKALAEAKAFDFDSTQRELEKAHEAIKKDNNFDAHIYTGIAGGLLFAAVNDLNMKIKRSSEQNRPEKNMTHRKRFNYLRWNKDNF